MEHISWTYIHHTNSTTSFKRIKFGVYYGSIRHTIRYSGPQLAKVKFDGNKRSSTVPFNELVFIDDKKINKTRSF